MANRRNFLKQVSAAGLASCIPSVAISGTALNNIVLDNVLVANKNSFADATKTQKIKIAQIGTGHMHAYKIGTLRKLTDLFEVVAVADDDPKQREKHENKGLYKDLPWMSTEELMAIPGLQAVSVETEEHDSLPYAIRCVKAGKHIHLDKPAGESLADFKQILDIAKSNNITLQMGYMYRNNPAVQFCFKAVKDGLLGEIYDIDAAMNRIDGQSFRNVIKTFKGGISFILTCHLIDMVVTMMGKPEKIHPYLRKTRKDEVIDNSLTVFEYSNGGIATMRTCINEVDGFQNRYITVRGSKGTITIRPLEIQGNMSGGKLHLTLAEATGDFKKGGQIIEMPPLKDRYEDQWIEFAHIINGKMKNPYTYEHDYLVQECLLKACEMHT
uniref:Gfo/Idh/MocA family protein n=1 Tax=uncultured Draconibacterium sp. TaxID=1573823 RepID=UPI0032175A88